MEENYKKMEEKEREKDTHTHTHREKERERICRTGEKLRIDQ